MLKITVYGTKTCPYCIELKKWLDKKSIAYTAYDIDENPIAAANMARLSEEKFVPFSTIEFEDGKIEKVYGFDKDNFESIIKATSP